MINRHEAREILKERVEHTSAELGAALDKLLRAYEDSFRLRQPFYLRSILKADQQAEVRFIGGVVERRTWSYLFETKATLRQYGRLPANVQIQIPDGQPMPLVPGLPRDINIDITAQGWMRNVGPLGVTT